MAITWPTLFRAIPPLLREELPPNLHAFVWTAFSSQAKAWYGNKALHYEIWVRYSARIVELGLHFEADALTNARLLGAFRSRAKDVKRGLGVEARIEEWDKGWTRVWEPFALEKLEPAYADRIQTRFVDYVRVLEPILRDELPSEVEWTESRARPTRVRTARVPRQSRRTRR